MTISRRTAGTTLAAAALIGGLPRLVQAAQPMATAQAPSFFRYRVGDIQVTAIHDGIFSRSSEGLVPNAPPGALQEALTDLFQTPDRLMVTFTALVVNTGGKLLLIDTGNGDLGASTNGMLMANFRAAGFDPANVDTVIFSHFHGDHINGFRRKDGTAVFPNAEIKVPAAEWAFWTSDDKRASAPDGIKPTFDNVRRVFGPVMNQVTVYNWDQEVAPGIVALQAAGHTPGHTCFAITSGTGRLLVLSDTTNDPRLFARNPGWSAIFDQDAEAARNTRRRMLDIAATERMQVSFYHAPFPATGHIRRAGDGFELVPLLWTPTT